MRILVCLHHRHAGLGAFGAPLAAARQDIVEWLPSEAPPPAVADFDALIALGGRARVADHNAHPWLRAEKELLRTAVRSATPTLGVCLGAQLLATAAGGTVAPAQEPEIGWHQIRLTAAAVADPILGALPQSFRAFEWHHDEFLLPPDSVRLARSATCLQAFRLRHRPAWGLQFHPEATYQNLATWLESWHADPGAVATGLDPDAIRHQTAETIDRSHALGKAIIERFLAHAGAAQRGTRHDCVSDASADLAV
jgi:GMP synthase-like glutamine amidotransferase